MQKKNEKSQNEPFEVFFYELIFSISKLKDS